MTSELLLFEVGEGTFAVPTKNVREVLRAVSLFTLPEYPDFVEGGLNLRGELLPAVDGRALLMMQRRRLDPADHLIVLANQAGQIAIRVDRAIVLTEADEQDLDASHQHGTFLRQVVNTQYGPAAVLDADHLIACCKPIDSTLPAAGQQT